MPGFYDRNLLIPGTILRNQRFFGLENEKKEPKPEDFGS